MGAILFNQLICRKTALIILATVFFHSLAISQTRFYLNTTASSFTPAFHAGWNVSSGATRLTMSTVKEPVSTLTTKASGASLALSNKMLVDQWISEPLAAQSLVAATFSGQVQYLLNNTSGGSVGQPFLYLRLFNSNGTLANEIGTANNVTTLTTTLTNRTFTFSLPSITQVITAGQRLVIELGWTQTAGTLGRTGTISKGSSSAAADLAVNNTTTGGPTLNPWFEFSQTLVFLPPANDACGAAVSLTPGTSCTPVTGNLQFAASAAPAGACGGATLTTTYDVWYKFVATAASQTVTVNNLGTSLAAASTYIESFSGACGLLTSLGCQTASTRQTLSGLTVGNTYYVRVYVVTSPASSPTANWNFDICIQQPPANDDCAGAVSLTPGASCVNTAGTLDLSTANGTTPLGCFAAGTYYDVWYKFVASTSAQTITLSSLGANITAPNIQIYSGACGALISAGCASGTVLTQTGLTAGATYYVRVANLTTNPSGAGLANFNICVTALTPPANDACANAATLTSGTSCVTTTGNIQYAGSEGPSGACGGATLATTYDVWYKFVATATTHTVSLSSLGTNLATATTYIEMLSGACGSLTSLGCQNASTRQTIGGLTIGTTYYVRVYVTSIPTNATTANWNFNICIQQPPANDDCTGAITLTPGASCVNTAGTLDLSTANGATPLGCFAAGTYYDVWYKFVATISTNTITLSSLGANITAPQIQIYSGTCGSLVSVACASGTTLTQPGLTVGATYYIRVANLTTNPSGLGLANFNICVTAVQPANDACANAVTLTSGTSCVTTTGNIQYANSEGPSGACGGATATTTYDVWYKFVATATTHTVSLSSLGTNLTAANTYIEMLSGSCGSLTSLGCQNASTRQTIGGLTIGTTYYVRVYVTSAPINVTTANWNFNICIQQPPANDECTGAITLTPGASCVNTAGTLDLSTLNGTTPLGCFVAGNYYDVWYKFVASTPIQTITLSSLGANITAPQIQLYSGACGALVSVACASGLTLQQYTLTTGATYYVRIANLNTNPSGAGLANFNICVTALTPPANDLCTGATLLTSGTSCTTTTGTFINATPTSGLPSCGNSGSADVWYRFVAQSNRPVITLGGMGLNFSGASPLIQLFTGSCGALTQVACAASPLNTAVTPGGVGLSINSTYYIRVTTNTNTGIPTSGTWGFNICVQDPSAAAVDYAKSYINVTDGTVGGTIDPGDILEIRATIVVARPGNTGSIVAIDSLAYYDTLSANKGFALLKDSMAVRTNEGKLFRPTTTTYFTDASDADAAWITTAGAGTDTALQINMGLTASRFSKSKLRSTSKPSNFGSTCIIMATYRVRVNAPYGTTINYGGGSFRYRDTITNIFYTITFPRDSLRVYSSPGACPDAISPTNVIGDEVNGTFGVTAGSPVFNQNRGTTPNTNYSYAPFGAGSGPGDYFYSVANNTSASGTTVQTIAKPNAARVFSVWDITGDHTGATNTAKGNPPCNLSAPVSAANPCGYMLVVNSAYRSDVAFQFNFNGACTETYYEISAWIKNICSKCGCDSNGVGAQNVGYLPTAPNDSAGVRPNIAFEINGVDYYTTGDLVYQGLGGTQTGTDTLNKWVKRSFVYKTKPNETGFMMTFRNNAPGGGGNDWALDDISIRTCYPNMTYSPSSNPSVCTGRTLTISDTVRSYYDVYIYYKWQRSTDGGANWVDLAGTNGVATPILVGPNNYQFINSYTLPPSATAVSNNGDLYRMVVATNAVNLAGTSCNYSDISPVTLTVLNNCIDIDDDNDGIPDYVEFNNPVALQDADGDLIPNWNDATYPGYVDYNLDLVNDNFDYGADANNNGIPNYLDPTFPGFVDSNGDGVNDNADKDLDGIPNQYDLDSDNDGIPDVVESYGVDTDGNGIIDNYVDADLDGFSQNVDANATGVTGSGNGLGAQDFDGDGIPNYLDTDSDNDGIPDVVEAGGSYITNNGKLANFVDANKDGISDNNVGAVTGLLKTGGDISPVDGRADSYPNKNLDRDFRPNAYDLDSDGDGIADVIEAGLPDANLDGKADGALGTNGWSTTVAALPSLTLPNTDGVGNPNYLDIDSDDDGIPDNIEGQSTLGYKLPTATDADGDGMVTPYDNFVGYGGSGIFPYDKDSDGIPDYIDTDTDSDGLADIVEGNDWNLNGLPDEVVTLTGLDTDGDGLDNRFDSLNSVTNLKGTSYMMGTGGTFTGDPAPGTKATVQKTLPAQIDRDWRDLGSVLPVQFLNFAGAPQGTKVDLSWIILATKDIDHFEIERSTDNTTYIKAGVVQDAVKLNVQQTFGFTDDISTVNSDIIYYKLKVVGKTGEIKYSNVLVVRNSQTKTLVNIIPNPAYNYANINLYADKNTQGKITIIDKVGRKVFTQDTKFSKGYNNIYLSLDKYSQGIYTIVIESSTEKIIKQLVIIR